MTFSYEQNQTGSQHALLTQVLKDTSYYINGSTFTLQRMVRHNLKESLVNIKVLSYQKLAFIKFKQPFQARHRY